MAIFNLPEQAIQVSAGPTMYVNDGVNTNVESDSADVSNNRPMPSGLHIQNEAGEWIPVRLDQTSPYTNTPIPVVLTDIAGASVVNVTASDLNVSIKHNGADPSSVRIGDGTNLAGVTIANEIMSHDDDVLQKLGDIETTQTDRSQKTQLSNGTIDASIKQIGTQVANTDNGLVTNAVIHGLNSGGGGTYVDVKVNPAGKLLTETDISGFNASLVGQKASSASLAVVLSTEQEAEIGALTETAPATDTASSGLNGRLQRIAQRISSLISLLPSSIGKKASTGSLSVTISSDEGKIAVTDLTHVKDSVKIGDGTTLAGVTLSNELKTNDANLNTAIGLKNDASATTDTGTFSLISLFKRSLEKLTILSSNTSVLGIKHTGVLATINGNGGALIDLTASTSAPIKKIKVSMNTGSAVGVYLNGSGSPHCIIAFGGDEIELDPSVLIATTRVSVKMIDATAFSGSFVWTLLG